MGIFKKLSLLPNQIIVCFIFIIVILSIIIFGNWIMPYDPNATDLLNTMKPPVFLNGTWNHPLGTDQIGRDILSRIIYGLRISAGIAFLGLLIGCTIGVTAGLISGYAGGIADKIITSLIDFQFAVPNTLIILMGIVLLGSNMIVLIALIGISKWESYARVTRAQVLSIRQNQYVEAAQASGASSIYIILRHILPNIIPTVIVMMTLYFPSVLTMESSLSYLGIGIQPPTATLGRMVGEGRNYLFTSWWISIIPAIIILTLTVVMQTLGDWLRDSMDIRNARE